MNLREIINNFIKNNSMEGKQYTEEKLENLRGEIQIFVNNSQSLEELRSNVKNAIKEFHPDNLDDKYKTLGNEICKILTQLLDEIEKNIKLKISKQTPKETDKSGTTKATNDSNAKGNGEFKTENWEKKEEKGKNFGSIKNYRTSIKYPKYINNWYEFIRANNSKFEIKYMGEVLGEYGASAQSCFVYKYKFRENNIGEYDLYTEFSPIDLFEKYKDIPFLVNVFFSQKRLKDEIFKIINLETHYAKIGNGYAGYFNKTQFGTFEIFGKINNPIFAYEEQKAKFIKQSNEYFVFNRNNGTYFKLKLVGAIDEVEGEKAIYQYTCIEGTSNEEKILYLNMSPEAIFDCIGNDNALDYFKNSFLSKERIFNVLKSKHGYAGHFKWDSFNIKYINLMNENDLNRIIKLRNDQGQYRNNEEEISKSNKEGISQYKESQKYSNYLNTKVKFNRNDGSDFFIEYIGECSGIYLDKEEVLVYIYKFQEGSREKVLYTELSPSELFEKYKNNLHFINSFFSIERLNNEVFQRRDLENGVDFRNINSGNYCGNGYAGTYIDGKEKIGTSYYSFTLVYVDLMQKFLELFKQNGRVFRRKDGSFFKLKFIEEIRKREEKKEGIYKYEYFEENLNQNAKTLYLNISIEDIFKYNLNNNAFEFLRNTFFEKNRIEEKLNNKNGYCGLIWYNRLKGEYMISEDEMCYKEIQMLISKTQSEDELVP